jgi:hypothetical protein
MVPMGSECQKLPQVLWIRIHIKLKSGIRFRISINVISWIRIRVRIKVKSWIRIRFNLQMTSRNVLKISIFEIFLKVVSHYLEARIRIRIWMRIKVKGRIRIRIRIKVTSRVFFHPGYRGRKSTGSATLVNTRPLYA